MRKAFFMSFFRYLILITYCLTRRWNYSIIILVREKEWNRFGCVSRWRSRFVFHAALKNYYFKGARAEIKHGVD